MSTFSKAACCALIAGLALSAEANGQLSELDWSFSGCAGLQGESLEVSAKFGGCNLSTSSAWFTADVQGTYTANVDWFVAQPALFGFIAISVNGDLVYIVSGVSSCSSPPCQGLDSDIPIPVEAGDTVRVMVTVNSALGGSLQATITGFEFTADLGILLGGGALDTSLLADVLGVDGASQGGTPMAVPGDLDQDGASDYAIGIRSENVVIVFSGKQQQLLHILPASGMGGGESLAGVGDLDGDGIADLAVGRPGADNFMGRVDLWSGASGTLLFSHSGDNAFDRFGDALSAAGDVNGDGTPDLLVGAPLADGPAGSQGLVSVLSGVDGSLISQFGDPLGIAFGSSLALVADLTQNGSPDLLVTAANNGAPGSLVQLREGVTGAVVAQFTGPPVGGLLRVAVASAGDLNGDGTADFAIGTPSAQTNGMTTGALVAYSGADLSVLFSHSGAQGSSLGHSVSAAGDVNGDGFDDLVVGAPFDGPGRATVVGGPAGQVLFHIVPLLPTGRLAMTVAGGGDINGDGFADVLASRLPYLGTAETQARVMVVSGAPADHIAPALDGSGSLLPGSVLQLTVSDGQPFGNLTLVMGSDHNETPFHGGVLVPAPNLALAGLSLDGTGSLTLSGRWPEGLPPYFSLWAQAWIVDRDALGGFAATNALQAIAP